MAERTPHSASASGGASPRAVVPRPSASRWQIWLVLAVLAATQLGTVATVVRRHLIDGAPPTPMSEETKLLHRLVDMQAAHMATAPHDDGASTSDGDAAQYGAARLAEDLARLVELLDEREPGHGWWWLWSSLGAIFAGCAFFLVGWRQGNLGTASLGILASVSGSFALLNFGLDFHAENLLTIDYEAQYGGAADPAAYPRFVVRRGLEPAADVRMTVIDGFASGYAHRAGDLDSHELATDVCDRIRRDLAGASHVLVIGGYDRTPIHAEHPLRYDSNATLAHDRALAVVAATAGCDAARGMRFTTMIGGPSFPSDEGGTDADGVHDRVVRLVDVSTSPVFDEIEIEMIRADGSVVPPTDVIQRAVSAGPPGAGGALAR